MSEEANNPDASIDPPDNGGTGLAGLSSAVEEALGESPEEAIDPPDNGGTELA